MDSSLSRLPPDFERAIADLRAARSVPDDGPLQVQIWRAGSEVAIAIPYRPGRGQRLTGGYDGQALYWVAEDGQKETTVEIEATIAAQLGGGLLVVYLDPEANAPMGDGLLTQQNAGGY